MQQRNQNITWLIFVWETYYGPARRFLLTFKKNFHVNIMQYAQYFGLLLLSYFVSGSRRQFIPRQFIHNSVLKTKVEPRVNKVRNVLFIFMESNVWNGNSIQMYINWYYCFAYLNGSYYSLLHPRGIIQSHLMVLLDDARL